MFKVIKMNEFNDQEIEPEEIDEEFPQEIPEDAKPKLSEEEIKLRKQIYAN